MAGEAFTWGAGGAKLTPEQLAIARQLLARKNAQGVDASPVGHWAQGAARIADALGDVFQKNRLDAQEADTNAYNTGLVEGLLSGSQPSSVPAATTAPTSSSASPTIDVASVLPDVKSGIIDTASALGVDPIDLATAISYETGGTFDPVKKGPMTQWGQHQGLIQFGEPQAKQFGVDWNNPVGSQLGAEGAVANYLRATGVKPGMGLMDIYSAINAGGVGLYDRSDANNGGAPGTVADKVNNQMAGHRANAIALLGQSPASQAIERQAPSSGYVDPMVSVQPQAMAPSLPTPTTVSAAPAVASVPSTSSSQVAPPQAIAQALRTIADPRASEGTRAVAQAILQQQQALQDRALAQQQQQQAIAQRQSIAQSMGINPSVALDDNAWKAAVEAANRGRQTTTVNGVVLDVNTGQPIFQAPQQPTTGMQDYNFYAESERQAGRQPLGPLEYEQALRSAGASRTNIDTGTVPQGYQAIRDEQGRLIRYDPVPGGPADTTKTQEKAQANTQRSSNIVLEDVDRAVSAIENNPALTTGIIGNWSRGIGGTPANKVQNLLQTVRANSAFDRLQQMREASPTGGALGAVSDSELGLLQNAIGSLEQSNNSEDLVYNLRRVQRIYEDIINGPEAAKKMREERSKASESASQPAQGWKDLGNGIKIRPKGSN